MQTVEAQKLEAEKEGNDTQRKFVIMSVVHHDQKQNAAPLQPWIVMEQNGQVHTGHCTCMAWLGEVCSHISAVLFYRVRHKDLPIVSFNLFANE